MIPVNLPVELVDCILDCFAPDLTQNRNYAPHVQFSRKQLATCSLVCRRWAKFCRQSLFRTIPLRSATDLTHFLRLTKSKGPVMPHIAQCIEKVAVESNEPSPTPWIHRISILSIFRNADVSIQLGPGYLRDWKYADFLHSLPLQLPRSIFRGIRVLHISGYHFPDTGAFLAILCGLPSLSTLECTNSTCVDKIVIPRAATSGLCPPAAVTLKDCGAIVSLLQACIVAFCYKVGRDVGVPSDALYEKATCLLSVISTADRDYKSTPVSVTLTGHIVVLACYPAFETKMDFSKASDGEVEASFEVQDSTKLRETLCDWAAFRDALSRPDTALHTVFSASYKRTVSWFSDLDPKTRSRFRSRNDFPAKRAEWRTQPSEIINPRETDVSLDRGNPTLPPPTSLAVEYPNFASPFEGSSSQLTLRQTAREIVEEYVKLSAAGKTVRADDDFNTARAATPRYIDSRYADAICRALLTVGRTMIPGTPRRPRRGLSLFLERVRSDPALAEKVFGEKLSTIRFGIALSKWKSLSDEEKKPFIELSAEAVNEYKAAKKVFEDFHLPIIMDINFGFLGDEKVETWFPIFQLPVADTRVVPRLDPQFAMPPSWGTL